VLEIMSLSASKLITKVMDNALVRHFLQPHNSYH
jgi:hypothetical protein